MTNDPDRHLLFGLLALQTGLIDQAQLVAAFHGWTRDRSRPLADHLEALGHLGGAQRAALAALAALYVEKHDGDVLKSLAALNVGASTKESLARAGGPEVEASTMHLGPVSTENGEVDRTLTYVVGTTSANGQRFRVLRPHARGGLGEVFVALDAELNREVALKEMLDRHADDPASRARFLREAEITGGLEHPGIVPVYGMGSYADGRPYYAMRFIKGDSLKQAIASFHADEPLRRDPGTRSLELRKLLRRFLDVCNAIEYAHRRGVLHRDLKPGNIMVGRYGETLVVDWGLAKTREKVGPGAAEEERTLVPSASGGSAETLSGSALGTPGFMSPEQAAGDLDRLGPRSDVYSLGATLYCLLTGKPPFEGSDLGAMLRAVQEGRFLRPREIDPTIDRALEAVCLKAMALRPEDRYGSPRELADDVERWSADEPVHAHRESRKARVFRWVRHHQAAAAGMAAMSTSAIVALAIAAVLLHAEERRTEQQKVRAERNVLQVRKAVQDFLNIAESEVDSAAWSLRDRLLRKGIEHYESFLKQSRGDRSLDPLTASTSQNIASLACILGLQRYLESSTAATVPPPPTTPAEPPPPRAAGPPPSTAARSASPATTRGVTSVSPRSGGGFAPERVAGDDVESPPGPGNPDSSVEPPDLSLALRYNGEAIGLYRSLAGENPRVQRYRDGLQQALALRQILMTDRWTPALAEETLFGSLRQSAPGALGSGAAAGLSGLGGGLGGGALMMLGD